MDKKFLKQKVQKLEDADAEECFFEKATEAGTKLGLSFQIAEGGFLDIDVRILGPDGKAIYEEQRQTSGKYTFAAHFSGIYTFCFSNKMSTMTPKVVMFDVSVGEPPKQEGQEDDMSADKLDGMIRELSASLTAVKQEQEYMVAMWSFFEAFILIAMTLGQVYYLKRFFEVRRVV
ncbi:hypothetical protein GWI33_020196 [Rhynchophorus ferrugineus]|uniref:GOLD domain-containing protein n=1 Tax=Rhynchophorus ferrugineus TaxID=354439 RepID=A0A834HWX2_RHYFE|nr:hypothetical protein GWI33_020196 [Rhynchophorus ferrugineus]